MTVLSYVAIQLDRILARTTTSNELHTIAVDLTGHLSEPRAGHLNDAIAGRHFYRVEAPLRTGGNDELGIGVLEEPKPIDNGDE